MNSEDKDNALEALIASTNVMDEEMKSEMKSLMLMLI
jgi:hypothetical protein